MCDVRNVFPDVDEQEQTSENEPPEVTEAPEDIQAETDESSIEEAEASPPDEEFLELTQSKSFWTGFNANKDVKFYLYSRKLWSNQQLWTNQKSFSKSKFNKNFPTRFVIHGWRNKYTDMLHIKDAYIKQGDVNCIMVDWSLGAGN